MSEPFLATKPPTASDEVARGRLVLLQGFPFAFRAKNREWPDSQLGFQVLLRVLDFNGGMSMLIPLRINLCVCVHHRRSKFVYYSVCVKVVSNNDFR